MSVKEKLTKIMKEQLFRDIDKLDNPGDERIFDRKIALSPAEAAYLFFAIEREFQITLPDDIIESKKFNKISDIVNAIESIISVRV